MQGTAGLETAGLENAGDCSIGDCSVGDCRGLQGTAGQVKWNGKGVGLEICLSMMCLCVSAFHLQVL